MDAFPQLNRIAAEKGCSPEALVLAYMQAKWPCVQHITSARRLAHLKDTLNSSSIAVSAEEIAAIDQDGDGTLDFDDLLAAAAMLSFACGS